MIQANELRIGNLVRSKVNGISKIEQIGSSINPEYVGGRSLDGNYWEDSYLPILLTDEWLVKFGFEKIKLIDFGDYQYHKFINGSEHLVWFIDYSMAIGGSKHECNKGLSYCSGAIFKHVHQLQNLYFSLTGQELKIK